MKKKFVTGLLFTVFLVSFALLGSAGATTLADVVTAGSITIGDKVFSGWTADPNWNFYAAPFGANNITFIPLPLPANDPGFKLSGMPMAVQALGTQDLTLSYTVTVLPGGGYIDDATLSFVGGVLGPPTTLASCRLSKTSIPSPGGSWPSLMSANPARQI